MGDEYEYFIWKERLDKYLTDKKREIEANDMYSSRQKELMTVFTEWAVNELLFRLIDICSLEGDSSDQAFQIIEDFLFEMHTYRQVYGTDKDNIRVELIFDIATRVAEDIGVLYFMSRKGY